VNAFPAGSKVSVIIL